MGSGLLWLVGLTQQGRREENERFSISGRTLYAANPGRTLERSSSERVVILTLNQYTPSNHYSRSLRTLAGAVSLDYALLGRGMVTENFSFLCC